MHTTHMHTLKDILAPHRRIANQLGTPALAVNIYLQAWDTVHAKDPRLLQDIYRYYKQAGDEATCRDILRYLQKV